MFWWCITKHKRALKMVGILENEMLIKVSAYSIFWNACCFCNVIDTREVFTFRVSKEQKHDDGLHYLKSLAGGELYSPYTKPVLWVLESHGYDRRVCVRGSTFLIPAGHGVVAGKPREPCDSSRRSSVCIVPMSPCIFCRRCRRRFAGVCVRGADGFLNERESQESVSFFVFFLGI